MIHNPVIKGFNPDPSIVRIGASWVADFLHARNTLMQRITGLASDAVTCLGFSKLEDGDVAGLAIANIPYAVVTIACSAEEIRVATLRRYGAATATGRQRCIVGGPGLFAPGR